MTDSADDPTSAGSAKAASARVREADAESTATLAEPTARKSTRSLTGEPDFGPRYRVVSMLGQGGMGEVYRAYDVELRGEVALKVIREGGDTDEAHARFRREIALARKVTNPNVLRVYDLADHKGLRFLSMEYVEGEDLGALLKRERRLPIERAIAMFRQVAAGLAAAHAEGVVHRDLKPANVLVDREGNARIADFGLARSVAESGMTASGAVLGSPAYMSPEQVKGEPTDERSDIYSLGVMLFQLVSGQTPFQAPTPHAVMEMRLHKKPQPLRELAPEASTQVEKVVARCLELDVNKRYPSVSALLADLDTDTRAPVVPPAANVTLAPAAKAPKRGVSYGLIGAGLAIAAGAIGLAALRGNGADAKANAPANGDGGEGLAAVGAMSAEGGTTPASPDGPVRTLVLSFENHTPETELDGTLSEIVRSTLRRSTRVDPIAGAQVRRLASELGPDVRVDDSMGPLLAARDHRKVLMVSGKIDQKGPAFSITLVAKDGATGQKLVDKTLDGITTDRIVASVARLTCEIRSALGEKITPEESELTGLSQSLEADHEYSLASSSFENGNYGGAVDHLGLAITADPGFSHAHARRAMALRNVQREEESSKELQAALKTIDQMGEHDRLKVLGDYYQYSSEEFDRAIASYTELLSKWPRDDSAETNLANAYQARGEAQAALTLARKASGEHPQNLVLRGNVAAFEINADDFDGAAADCHAMMTDLPRPTTAMLGYNAIALATLWRHDEVMTALAPYRKADPSNANAFEADFAMAEGRWNDAATLLEKGIADDTAAKNPDGAEVKLATLAELRALKGDKAGARTAALQVKNQPPRRFIAALALLAAGDAKDAKVVATSLTTELAPSRRVLAKMIDAEALRVAGKPRDAMLAFQDALKLVDVPMSHYLLARAALDAKEYGEAYSELMHCLSHRGQFANGVDDITSFRYVPLFTYYLAKAQDGLGSAKAASSYQAFLTMMKLADADHPFAVDARAHAK